MLASIGDRFTGQFIDGLCALAVGTGVFVTMRHMGFSLEWSLVAWVLYLLLCDALPGGQSLGKRVTKIAVVRVRDGAPCGLWRSLVRNTSLIVLGVFDCVPLVGRERRRIGDYIAGTKVVRCTGVHSPR
ncbi:RDD family protein [Aquabacterium sp. A7-Y]|uniref:RDD family protein n=1 Tax=Aquabacterium sp. A7-Y TaxID=1349605 RepID=UPI00223E5B28|nr:RDD family protein [Aquabacterium sp. A7-Y]MCW7539685.1 RDD family protein [Aquabacterium sp. A7-Y]